MSRTVVLDPGEAQVWRLRRGETLRIVDLEGSQVADVIGVLPDQDEWISPPETVNLNFSFVTPVGAVFYTSRRRPGLRLVRDDSEGIHDLTNACCSPEFYEKHGYGRDHPNCHDAFAEAFSRVGVDRWQMATPINFFQMTERGPGGQFVDRPAGTGPGTTVDVEALLDLWLGVSCCPCDIEGELGSIAGSGPSPVQVSVHSGPHEA